MKTAAQHEWIETVITHGKLTPQVIDSEQELIVDQPSAILIVEGTLNLALDIYSDSLYQERTLFTTIPRLSLFFFTSTEREQNRIIMQPEGDTSILLFTVEQLLDLYRSEVSARPFGDLIDHWADESVDNVINSDPTQQENRIHLRSGHKQAVDLEHCYYSKSGVTWIPVSMFEVLGLDENAVQPHGIHWPLSGDAAVRSVQHGGVDFPKNRKLFTAPEGEQTLSQLAEFFFANQIQQKRKELDARLDKKKRQSEERKLILNESLTKAVGLLSPGFRAQPDSEDKLLLVSLELIHSMGELPTLPKSYNTSEPIRFLERIAESSGLTLRNSILPENWWESDFGSFIGFDIQGTPFLFSHNGFSYSYWDSISKEKKTITAENGHIFQSSIYSFYRRFEDKKLRLRDLILFQFGTVKKEFITLLFLATIGSGLTTLVPIMISFMIQTIFPSAAYDLLWIFGTALIAIGFFKVTFEWLYELLLSRLNNRLDLVSTIALWDRILHFSTRVLSQFSAGDLSVKINTLSGMQSFYRTFIQKSIFYGIQSVFSIGLLFWIDPKLGGIALLTSTILLVVTVIFGLLQQKAFSGGERSLGIVNSFVLEMFTGINKIRSAAAEVSMFSEWAKRYSTQKSKMIASQKVGLQYGIFATIWATFSLVIIYYGVTSFLDEEIPLGQFFAFLSAFTTLNSTIGALAGLLMQLAMQIPMKRMIQPLLDNVPEPRSGKLIPPAIEGNIRVESVAFSYGNGVSTLSNVSFAVPKGGFLALVGASGCGKSTLLKLLAALDKPARGKIFIDDYEMQSLDKKALKESIAIVSQDYKLFPGTLYENIRGASNASYEDVCRAAKTACIFDDIDAMPMGLHTIVTGSGGLFSGGQTQRIAIARAIARNPKIILFDEATSALDNRIQKELMENLNTLNITKIFIAHRLNTIVNADQILVLHNGGIAQKGTWEELVSKDGHFKNMVTASKGAAS